MSFSVNTNLGALQAYNALAKVNAQTEKAQLRLATTKKINTAADDTSGWNIGKQLEASNLIMKSQLANIGSAKNFLSTAESALQQVYDKLNQIQAKKEDYKDPLKDATSIQNDITTLAEEINSILNNTEINGTDLLASASNSFGAGGSANVSINIGKHFTSLTYSTDPEVDNTTFQTAIRTAITYIGNTQQTLDSREEFITASVANNTAAISRLFDADMASEQLNATKGQISGQVATAMLAQMNSAPQNILSLFR